MTSRSTRPDNWYMWSVKAATWILRASSMPKRSRAMDEGEEDALLTNGGPEKGSKMDSSLETPTKRRRGRPPGSTNKTKSTPNGRAVNEAVTPKGRGKVLFPNAKRGSSGSGQPPATASRLIPETPNQSQRARRSKTLIEAGAVGSSDVRSTILFLPIYKSNY